MRKKICIVNAHWSNRGDEAALRPIIDALLVRDNGIELTVIFKDKKEVQRFPYSGVRYFSAQFLPKDIEDIYDCIRNKCDAKADVNLRKTVDCLREANLIIYSPGGAVISSKFWWIKQLEYLTPFICAKEFNIPLVVAAPSMGPYVQDVKYNNVIKEYLSESKRIIVREPISKMYLQDIGVNGVLDTVDTAFFDDVDEESNRVIFEQSQELCQFFSTYPKVVAITMSDFVWNVQHKDKYEMLRNNENVMQLFIAELQKKGYGILLVPQLFGNQNDSEYLKKFINDNSLILSDEYDAYFQQYVISKCFALVGMRYHSNIFAAKAGIPFIAIGYEEKMYGFMEQWCLSKYLIRIEELTLDNLENRWEILCQNYQDFQKTLIDYRSEWKKRAQVTIESIFTCL